MATFKIEEEEIYEKMEFSADTDRICAVPYVFCIRTKRVRR